MKYLLPACLIVFLFTGYPLHAQKKNKKDEAAVFYLFKQNWSLATNLDSAAYFMQIIKENDTTYLCRYYNKYGPMLKQESFKDEQLTTPNGVFLWYNKEGYLDSAGNVSNGHKNGNWNFYRDNKTYLTLVFRDQHVFEMRDYDADIYMDSAGVQQSLKEKMLQDSLSGDSLMRARDSTKPNQVEAKFHGDWNGYISRNLETPDRLVNVLGTGRYDVIVSFTINKEGNIVDVILLKSVEWSGDAAVFNLFKHAPPWTPAQQNGKPVLYRQKQKLSFNVGQY